MHITKISPKVNNIGLTNQIKATFFSMQVFATTTTNANAVLAQNKHRHSQGRRSWGGCGGPDPPWKYVGGVRVCFDPPENVTFFHSKLVFYNFKFYNIKDE